MSPPAELSIVVGTYNRLDQLRMCIESILRETRTGFVLHVTDAGSTDGTVEFLRELASERIRPHLVGRRLGQARAYNEIFALVDTPHVCWLSDDNIVVDGGLDLGLEILRRDSRIGMVGLKVRDIAGPFAAAPYIGGISEFGILNVNQGMLPTRVLRQVGGFSEAFRDYGIDPDLTAKVLLSGWDVVYTKRVAIHHQRNWPSDTASAEWRAMMARQAAYREMYRAKYRQTLAPSPTHLAKRAAWKAIRSVFGRRLDLDSHEPVIGQLPRDWNNILAGRFISLFDGIRHRREPFHLRQHCPRRVRPARLPVEESAQPSSAASA